MNKSCKIVVILTMMVILAVSFVACNKEKAEAGKYNLTEVTGVDGITAKSYEYNYIQLNSDGEYRLKNLYSGTVTDQGGEWTVKGTDLTMTPEESTQKPEVIQIKDGIITIELNSLKLIYTKEK